MAAPMKHLLSLQKLNKINIISAGNARNISFLGFGKKKEDEAAKSESAEIAPLSEEYDETPPAPPTKFYEPKGEIESTILAIANDTSTTPVDLKTKLSNSIKFNILAACEKEFNYEVLSMDLADLDTLSDVVRYYSTSRNPLTPEEVLQNSDLPPNMHLLLEPFRFTEVTKERFGGKTAFPGRDTKITSLKYRHIYEGYKNPKRYTKKEGFAYY